MSATPTHTSRGPTGLGRWRAGLGRRPLGLRGGSAEASQTARPLGRRLTLLALGAFGAGTVLGAALGASRLGLFVPPAGPGSLRDAAAIFTNNMEICALLVALTLLQPRGVANLARGFFPLWLTDLSAVLVVAVNLAAIGTVVGALGLHALVRMLPHAPLEIGGYLVLVVAYLRARGAALERREALRMLALAVLLLACAALLESFVSGALP